MRQSVVLDSHGRCLSPTSAEKAHRLIEAGKAVLVQAEPMTIRLQYDVPEYRLAQEAASCGEVEPGKLPGAGQRLLLHICCAPCSTYSVKRLRERGFDVTGHWYNPNIHPFTEHERRRKTLVDYAAMVGFTVRWESGYEMIDFMRAVSGHEQFRVRCQLCYQMRLERTAAVAAREGFHAFTTTLLISPYQDQRAIRSVGQQLATRFGVPFYYEDLRSGWAEHWTMTRDAGLYRQRYCGCIYSEWEAQDRGAATLSASGSPSASSLGPEGDRPCTST